MIVVGLTVECYCVYRSVINDGDMDASTLVIKMFVNPIKQLSQLVMMFQIAITGYTHVQ